MNGHGNVRQEVLASIGAIFAANGMMTIASDADGGVEQGEPVVMVRESIGPKLDVWSNKNPSNLHNEKPDQSGIRELP